jgi:hypothetical protein
MIASKYGGDILRDKYCGVRDELSDEGMNDIALVYV